MRYFIELSYNGASFHGWQSQPNAQSVQSSIEEALSKIFRQNIHITGAGRTDTGVHARQMFAHFDIDTPVSDVKRFLLSLNSLVGKYISINNVFEVSDSIHARFDATERTYKYFVSYKKNPFLKDYSWLSPTRLDMEAMNKASDILLQTKDFTSFAKLHSDSKTNICDVREAFWCSLDEDKEALDFLGSLDKGIVFTISADRFLRNMVRAVVGTLVDVGRHKISIELFRDIINKQNRCAAGISMPANALFLWKISYPDKTLKSI